MRAIPSILLLAVCAAAADQPAEPVTCVVTHDPTGVTTVKVHNGGPAPLTGFNFIYVLQREVGGPAYGATIGYYDSATDPQYAREIPVGQDIELPFRFGGNGYFAKVSIAGSIFADGTTYGEKATVQKIFDRRNYMLVSLNKSIGELTQDLKAKMMREQIIAQFQTDLNNEMGAGLDQDLTSCIQTVRGLVLGTLRTARAADGSILPTETIIDSILETLKTRRDLLKK